MYIYVISDLYCQCLYYNAVRFSRAIERLASERFSREGLSASHAFALMAIADATEGSICVGRLADILGIDPSTMTRFADCLASRGLVEREREGRRTGLVATEEGRSVAGRLRAAWAELHAIVRETLGEDEASALTEELGRARALLEGQSTGTGRMT